MGMSQADGFQPGPMGVEGIVLLSQEDEESEKSESGKGKGGDDDKSSVHSYVRPKALNFSPKKVLKSPARAKGTKKKATYGGGGAAAAAWPRQGDSDDEEQEEPDYEEEEENEEGEPSEEPTIRMDHLKLYDWLNHWVSENGAPSLTPVAAFNMLTLDDTIDGWLTGVEEEVNVPRDWHQNGWLTTEPKELLCVFVYLTLMLTIADIAVESGKLTTEAENGGKENKTSVCK